MAIKANLPQRKRGARPTPRHLLAAATPHFLVGPTPPSQFSPPIPQKLDMWENATYGCCVTSEEAFAKACAGIFIEDGPFMAFCRKYDLLNGADLGPVIDLMNTDGFQQDGNSYRDGPKKSVDWTNTDVLHDAITQGSIKIGVAADQLQEYVGSSNGSMLDGFHPDNNIDHCVSLAAYGPMGWLYEVLGVTMPDPPAGITGDTLSYLLYTWSTISVIDRASMLAITGEAWLRTPTTVIVGTGTPTPDPLGPEPSPPINPIPPDPNSPPPPPPGPVVPPPPPSQLLVASGPISGTCQVKAAFGNILTGTFSGTATLPVGPASSKPKLGSIADYVALAEDMAAVISDVKADPQLKADVAIAYAAIQKMIAAATSAW